MSQADDVLALVAAVRPLFRGRASEIQGAVLAELMAIWLAGHVVRGDPAATKRWRAKILKIHLETVREFVPINYAALIEPQLRADA